MKHIVKAVWDKLLPSCCPGALLPRTVPNYPGHYSPQNHVMKIRDYTLDIMQFPFGLLDHTTHICMEGSSTLESLY